MSDITMPKLSDAMEEGTIITWLKTDGETVEAGEDLVEIETDKATVTHAAETSGVLTIVAREGSSLPVGATIARIGAPADSPSAATAPSVDGAAGGEPIASNGAEVPAPASPGPRTGGHGGSERRPRVTPVARRVAAHHGVDLEHVVGSGLLGHITRADVLRAAGIVSDDPSQTLDGREPAHSVDHRASAAPAAAPPGAPADRPGVTRREPTRLQRVVARRMAEAKAVIPHFQVQTEAAMDATVALRTELRSLVGDHEPVPSLNDIVIKAAAMALREFPLANGSFAADAFELHESINVGMAVAAEETLLVPTIFDADTKSLGEIARTSRRLAARGRDGELTPQELSGGTFTVSNLGMFGMTAITPVINPPQAAILGVGALREVLARVDGDIVTQRRMTLTLSCDHRILYGADAARFLSRIKELLEQPLRLAL